jgi:CelD/BcsL family acetyltransferase involved in cellulose biosynthesis
MHWSEDAQSPARAFMDKISVSISSPELEIAEPWSDLIRRAPANVFMHPAALKAAHATGFADIRVLLAWARVGEFQRLVGLWALQRTHTTLVWPSFLSAPPYDYAFVSNPVVDRDFTDDVIAAFFNAIACERSLPKVIRLRYLDGNDGSYRAISDALSARGAPAVKLSERERPYVTRESGLKRTGSTRKKLRQDWNRLASLGSVAIINERTHAGAVAAFETYLAMEAASWKGSRGTALLCDAHDADFARRLISDLATADSASVALLCIDDHAIAAQVLLYCGNIAYTWKTAFAVEFGKFSPGALLVDKVSEQLFADGSVETIESCSPDGGFMNQIWDGRRATVDMLADVGPRKSTAFRAVLAGVRGYAQLRDLRNRFRDMPWSAYPWRKRAAISR